jgi:Putative prokaryotic signal transducing protein
MIGILRGLVVKATDTTPGGAEAQRWVVIAIVSWTEATVMRSKLESENIPCLLQREAAGAVFGITIGPLGEVRVLVPEPLADKAVELLSENTDTDIEGDEADDDADMDELSESEQ